jgi:CRISPR-associated Csx2 family protein
VRILGTSGSMWDVLILEQGDTSGREAQWDELANAVNNDAVTQSQLSAVEDLLNGQESRRYQLRLIPYGFNDREQIDILRALTEGLDATQNIILDITHALRHLPMLGLLSAFYLRAATDAKIEGIYYGALERTDKRSGLTPVLRLDGLLKLYDWIRALEQFNKDGDYSSFKALFNREGLPGDLLGEAAFLERIANASLGSQKLNSAMQQIDNAELSPAASLFAPLLKTRTAWRNGGDRAARERALASDYLSRRDYLRATQFGFESLVSSAVWANKRNPNNMDDREEAERSLYDVQSRESAAETPGNFKTIKNLRNALAHGVMNTDFQGSNSQFIRKLTENEELLRDWLTRSFKKR